ncbi:MAG: hypothetical protein EBY11_15510 [Proteobacteria bacterium]|nr:hypothetical protein [Pseudomonadota bacterium]
MVDQLFNGATGTLSNTASGTTTLEDLGITTAGTLTIVAGVDAGTGGAANTATLAEIGVTAAGTLTITATEGANTESTTVAYSLSDTIETLRLNLRAAMRAMGTVTGSSAGTMGGATATYAAGVLELKSNDATVNIAVTDSNVSGGARAIFGITGTGADTVTGSAVDTLAQSETVTVSYAITDTISSLAGNIQTALRAAGAIGNSTLTGGTLAAATAAESSGILTLTAVGADAKFSTITSSTDGGDFHA